MIFSSKSPLALFLLSPFGLFQQAPHLSEDSAPWLPAAFPRESALNLIGFQHVMNGTHPTPNWFPLQSVRRSPWSNLLSCYLFARWHWATAVFKHSLLTVFPAAPPAANSAYCPEKDVDAELDDGQDALMRCEQAMPMLVGGLYTQSLSCDRATPDLQLQDSSSQDTR